MSDDLATRLRFSVHAEPPPVIDIQPRPSMGWGALLYLVPVVFWAGVGWLVLWLWRAL